MDSAIGGDLVPSLLVRSGSNWVPEKGIYVMQGGSWQRKMGYVYVNGQWVPLSSGVIYMEGYEAVPLTSGTDGNGYTRRDPTAIVMFSVGTLFVGTSSWFTTINPIDLTPYSQIRVLWRNAGHSLPSNTSLLRVRNSSGVLVRDLTRTSAFDWREDSLNISDLTGPHYLTVEAWVRPNNETSYLFVSQWYLV